MAFNFINGIQIGGDASASPFAYGPRMTRRMLWNWMVKVIGYTDLEKSGANWDNPQLGPITDGATDATDVRRFTSSTGGFTAAMEQSFLLVFPTAAPATAGGFTDATRNGFYRIKRVFDTNTISVETFNGVHSDGLPLSETGLRFEVHNFRPVAELPVDTNYFVIRGTGVGGSWDAKWTEDYAANYGPTRIQVSPFADWVAGAPGSFSPGTRLTSEAQLNHQALSDISWVWAVGDLTQIIVWIRYFDTAFVGQEGQFIYLGDVIPFHAAQDTKPVVVSNGALGAPLDELPSFSFRMLAADDTTALTAGHAYLSQHAGTATAFHGINLTARSQHSGRFVRSPIVLYTNSAGNEEIRGQLKSLDHGHSFGPRGPIPFGTTFDRIRFFTQMNAPWNGSKINRYVF